MLYKDLRKIDMLNLVIFFLRELKIDDFMRLLKPFKEFLFLYPYLFPVFRTLVCRCLPKP